MVYSVMDVMDLKYEDNYFDAAIDKSTADALFCGDDSFSNIAKMTKEVQRVLKPGGVYMVISYGAPENRVFHFQRPHLSFSLEQTHVGDLDDPNDVHYVYFLTKNADAE
jgi:ubiquinone/menaquinone biosynthesis C-methylase UbiE